MMRTPEAGLEVEIAEARAADSEASPIGTRPRRVLYVINGFNPGGAEHGLLTLIRGGFFADCDLHVFALCEGQPALAGEIANAVGPGRFHLVRKEPSLSLAGMLGGTARLFACLWKLRPDLVVLSLKQANIVGRFALIFFPSAGCASFEHIERYRARRAEWIYGALLKLLSFRVDSAWADCQLTLDSTRRYFLPRRRTGHVVPLFAVSEEVPPKAGYARSGPLRLAAAGRLVPRKNFDRLIDAVRILRDEGIDVRLTIYGDGPEQERLQGASRTAGLEACVTIAGHVPQWFAAARQDDLFINLSETEGFCIVVAEAMSVGLPVICTDVGGIREYGRDGENMFKIADVTPATVAAVIARHAADPALLARVGQSARADMIREYSAGAIRRKGREVLADLLPRPPTN